MLSQSLVFFPLISIISHSVLHKNKKQYLALLFYSRPQGKMILQYLMGAIDADLKGHWHEKSISTKHLGGCLRPYIGTTNIFKHFLILQLKQFICKWKHEAVLAMYGQNGDCFYAHVADRGLMVHLCPYRRPIFYCTWCFPRGWQPQVKLFSLRSRPHTTKIRRGHTGNESKWWALHRVLNSSPVWGIRLEDFYIETTMLLKILAFKRTSRKFLITLAVRIEGMRHPPICLFDALFRVNVPLKSLLLKMLGFWVHVSWNFRSRDPNIWFCYVAFNVRRYRCSTEKMVLS
jgi:hypothetical protein